MKLHRNSLLTAAAIVLVLYLACLIVGLPGWAAVVLTVVLLVLLAVVWKQPDPPRPVVTTPPSAPSVVLPDRDPVFTGPPSRTVADVRLPSASPDFQFSFSAVVQWSTVLSGARHADLGAIAVDALLERARALAATQQVTEEALNQHRLAALLGEPALDEKGQVRSWATEVRLRLPDADQKHLQHLAALHRREQTALLERRMEQDKRTYLKEDVFATPGSAAVWWLVNNPGQVETALGLLDTLAELSAAANDLPVRRSSADVIDRANPPRAELDFNSAVDHLLDAGQPASGSVEPSTRSVPRHAGPEQSNDNPSPAPTAGTNAAPTDGPSSPPNERNGSPQSDRNGSPPNHDRGLPQNDDPGSQQSEGTARPASDRPSAGLTDQQPNDWTIPPSADATTSKSARNGSTHPSGEQPEAKYREQFYTE